MDGENAAAAAAGWRDDLRPRHAPHPAARSTIQSGRRSSVARTPPTATLEAARTGERATCLLGGRFPGNRRAVRPSVRRRRMTKTSACTTSRRSASRRSSDGQTEIRRRGAWSSIRLCTSQLKDDASHDFISRGPNYIISCDNLTIILRLCQS